MTYSVRRLRAYDRDAFAGRAAPRILEPTPFCWMCSRTSGKSTKEHVFARTLLNEFPPEQKQFSPARFNSALYGPNPLGKTHTRGPMPGSALVAGEVCAQCNNLWMSKLEVDTKPLLVAPPARMLTTAEALTLTQWFIKTAIVINVSNSHRLLWSAERRHGVVEQRMPNVAVWLFRVPDSDLNWIQARPGGLSLRTNPIHGVGTETASFIGGVIHSCAIQVGTLVGHVVAYPGEIASSEFEHAGTLLWKDRQTGEVDLSDLAVGKDLWDHTVHINLRASSFWSGGVPVGYWPN